MIRAKKFIDRYQYLVQKWFQKDENKDSGQNYNEVVSASIILARTGFRPDRVTQLTQKFQ